jgi:hypothetical protein
VLKWNSLDLIISHQGMWLLLSTVRIELFLKKFIDRLVDVKRRTAGAGYFVPYIQPETPRALHKQLDFRSRQFIRRLLTRLIR